ncbi:hypothetical protein, partial [Nocardia neocaledoniensis]|uniref:hypothetical protein n=1 Tax=Nocardia neocaledoniensis TaxID=236511 RepID=UPI002457FC36
MLGARRCGRWAAAPQDSTAHFRVGHFGHTVEGDEARTDGRDDADDHHQRHMRRPQHGADPAENPGQHP